MASTEAANSAGDVHRQTCFCFLQAYSKIITDPEASVVLWLDSVVHTVDCKHEELPQPTDSPALPEVVLEWSTNR